MLPNPYESPRSSMLPDKRPTPSPSGRGPKQTQRMLILTAILLVIAAVLSHALGEDDAAFVALGGSLAVLCFNRSLWGTSRRTRIALFCAGVLSMILGFIAGSFVVY